MLKRSMQSIAGTWVSGLLALLPITLTLAVVGWLVGVLIRSLGPESVVGRLFAAVGAPLTEDSRLAYLIGTLLLVVALYPLGLAVQAGLKGPLQTLADHTLRRIPLLGSLYDTTDRMVGLLDRTQQADLRAMSPVWCFFGGEGVAVLALAPSHETIPIDGRDYRAVLVPTSPVPIGGGLLYVPAAWVKPAEVGIDRVVATYVSMGITPPVATVSKARTGSIEA
ncbi:MAG: DUF502 domain-containing protein [Spirochaetaceae bacterium]|nr:DUF502 domain-containing protein [Myxococcales bacterium]MCB9723155.1 DUF502 domain-containing protein [Spirochaetaceae bacterium]HPG24584.1 DUF502 domain-containing protein [Myxococcota bacterium]